MKHVSNILSHLDQINVNINSSISGYEGTRGHSAYLGDPIFQTPLINRRSPRSIGIIDGIIDGIIAFYGLDPCGPYICPGIERG